MTGSTPNPEGRTQPKWKTDKPQRKTRIWVKTKQKQRPVLSRETSWTKILFGYNLQLFSWLSGSKFASPKKRKTGLARKICVCGKKRKLHIQVRNSLQEITKRLLKLFMFGKK